MDVVVFDRNLLSVNTIKNVSSIAFRSVTSDDTVTKYYDVTYTSGSSQSVASYDCSKFWVQICYV